MTSFVLDGHNGSSSDRVRSPLRPIATHAARFVVCLDVLGRLVNRAETTEPITIPFGEYTRIGTCWPSKPRRTIEQGAHWRQLANTTDPCATAMRSYVKLL